MKYTLLYNNHLVVIKANRQLLKAKKKTYVRNKTKTSYTSPSKAH